MTSVVLVINVVVNFRTYQTRGCLQLPLRHCDMNTTDCTGSKEPVWVRRGAPS